MSSYSPPSGTRCLPSTQESTFRSNRLSAKKRVGGEIVRTNMYRMSDISRPASIGGTPRRMNFPWLAVNSTPSWMRDTTPVASTVIVVPVPPVMFLISFTRPSVKNDVFITWVAPKPFASSSRDAIRSIAIIARQPLILAPWIQIKS